CEHHLLNLSVSGKIYRNGPQRVVYNNSTVKMTQSVPIQTELSGDLPPEVRQQMEKDLLKNGPKVASTTILKVSPSDNNLHEQLKEQFGEAFLESQEGQSLLKQLEFASPTSTAPAALAHLLDKPMPDIMLTDFLGKSVKLETFRGKFILLHIFSINSDAYGPKLRQLEKRLENYDASVLQAIGISPSDSDAVKAIEAFKDKHQLSIPIWIDKNDQIRTLLKRETSESDKELVTLILNPELVVKDVSVDLDPESVSRKLEKLIASKK
ncbi:redoxin domain-containing protein, partial [Candidatus Poribacteria bacterium]|nr:redoxin domain-containing protein [Candidatus Poribacteria bacterium]